MVLEFSEAQQNCMSLHPKYSCQPGRFPDALSQSIATVQLILKK